MRSNKEHIEDINAHVNRRRSVRTQRKAIINAILDYEGVDITDPVLRRSVIIPVDQPVIDDRTAFWGNKKYKLAWATTNTMLVMSEEVIK